MNTLTVKGLCKTYQIQDKIIPVLQDLDLTLPDDGITVILGKSGCGKTTLLRLLAGLEEADAGEINLPHQCRIGMVFQEPRLMPWLTVTENVLFGLPKKERATYPLQTLLQMVGLEDFANGYPRQLSGGMQQRVAIARVIACEPSLILMDEPFAALDNFNRELMQAELLRIQHDSGKSIIFVTHNIDEALILGRRIVLMEQGVIQKMMDLSPWPYPRDLLASDIIQYKKEILQFFKPQEH